MDHAVDLATRHSYDGIPRVVYTDLEVACCDSSPVGNWAGDGDTISRADLSGPGLWGEGLAAVMGFQGMQQARTGAENREHEAGRPGLDIYWRQGCGYCSTLRRFLRRKRVVARWHNIWEDPQAASIVRTAAGGTETVPTVVIGGRAFVNPDPHQLFEHIRRTTPDAVAASNAFPSWWRRLLQRGD